VFKFKLEIVETPELSSPERGLQLDHDRVIPGAVKLEVWKRDKGQCVICGTKQDLHFDHVIPYSQGGSSRGPKNVQILCAKHNLAKRDNIQ
jgi:5-methylcytosine-specific restriction endonuclease McrA